MRWWRSYKLVCDSWLARPMPMSGGPPDAGHKKAVKPTRGNSQRQPTAGRTSATAALSTFVDQRPDAIAKREPLQLIRQSPRASDHIVVLGNLLEEIRTAYLEEDKRNQEEEHEIY